MSEKSAFPGVSLEKIKEQEQKDAARQKKEQERKERNLAAVQAKNERDALRQRFNPSLPVWSKLVVILGLNTVMGMAYRFINDYDGFESSPQVEWNHYTVPLERAITETYVPYYHAGYEYEGTTPAQNGGVGQAPYFSDEVNQRFIHHLVLLVVELLVLGLIEIGNIKANRDIDFMAKFAKTAKETEKAGIDLKLDSNTVSRLLKVLHYIVEDMSEEERVYFDILMDKKVESQDTKAVKDFAVAVLKGHLKSHPEDAQRILDAFEEKTIPEDLWEIAKRKARNYSFSK